MSVSPYAPAVAADPSRHRPIRAAIAASLALACAAGVLVLGGSGPEPYTPPASPHAPAQAQTFSTLPLGAQAAISRGLGADTESFFAHRGAGGSVSLENRTQRLRATVDAGRVAVSGANGVRVGLSTPEIGRAGALSPLSGLTRAELKRNRVNLSSGTSSEWLANGPAGVEQGFTISEHPAGRGPLTISQRVSGNAAARIQTGGHGITL